MRKRQPIHDLLKQKARRRWLHLHAVSGAEAGAATGAGSVIRSGGADAMLVRVRAAARTVGPSGGMQHRRVALREQAIRVRQKLRNLESAGAARVAVGVVSEKLADGINRTMRRLTIGLGCGNACDTRYLFSCDLDGTRDGHDPCKREKSSHRKPLGADLQVRRVTAFKDSAADVIAADHRAPQPGPACSAPHARDF